MTSYKLPGVAVVVGSLSHLDSKITEAIAVTIAMIDME